MNILFLILTLTGIAYGSPRFDKNVDRDEINFSLERHKRMYFISGTENTKVQLSFKIPVIIGSKFYFAYSETGFWKLYQKSSNPFEDITHNPELFYRLRLNENHSLDLGMEHVSNGRDGDSSRSWNSLYLQNMSKFREHFYKTGQLFQL